MKPDYRLFRGVFYKEFFEPYNRAVKLGRYDKIPYEVWRRIRDWCTADQWAGYDIDVTAVQGGYHIELYHNYKTCPEIITVVWSSGSKSSFAGYLADHEGELSKHSQYGTRTLETAWKSIQTAADCSSAAAAAISSLNDALQQSAYAATTLNTYDFNDSDCRVCASVNLDCYLNGKTLQETIEECIEKCNNIQVKEKENNNMKFGNFDFGPVDSSVRMSLYGMAIKNASGNYVAYDTNSKQVMDVDILNFDGANKFIYKMPVAIKDVRSGDVVIHARKPMFVQMVCADNRLKVLDIFDGEEKTIVLTQSPFGFNFITKVVSLVNMTGTATESNPFGNMLPFLLMSDSKNTDDILPLMLMTNGGLDMSNPMMLYFLCGKGTMDPLALAMMMGSMNKPTHSCACGGNCKDESK